MKVDIGSLARHLAILAWVALRSFVGTVLVLTLAGCVLAGLSFLFFAYNDHWLYGVVAVAVALIESVSTGIFLGAKRAGVMAVAHGFGTLRLGQSLVRLVFERMLGIAAADEMGERGGRIARHLERLPLAQADALLTSAIRDLTGEAAHIGWLRRRIQATLLDAVRKYTLARFRAEGAQHGGVDLLKLKEELEQSVDDALVQKVRGGLTLVTALVILGLPVAIAAQTWVALALLRSG